MAGKSAFEGLSQAIVDAIGAALDDTNPNLAPLSPPNAAAARNALTQLAPRAQAITNAADPVAWINAVDQWREKLREVADNAFGPPAAPDAMLVRLLEERMPRTAAFLSLVGVIVRKPSGQDAIDWAKAQQFFTDPGTLVNESLWDALLGDASIPGTGRLPAVIVALLLLAPHTIIALARGDIRVAGLPSPPTDAPGPWRTFREASTDWVSFTVPLGDPVVASPKPRGIYDWVADLLPDISATLALHSRRVQLGGGKNRTEFEMWLSVAFEKNEWRYDIGDTGWFLRLEPGISGGFGYDGSWHGAFRQMLTNTNLVPGPQDPVSITFGRELPGGAPDFILGPPYDTRLVANDVGLFLRLREGHPIVEVGGFVHGFAAVLTNRWWRTFGVTNELFGDGIRLDLDLDIAYVEGKGLQLNLGVGLDVTFNIDKEWGKSSSAVSFKLHSIRLFVPIQATAGSLDIRGEITFHISLRIGPVTLVVSGLGGWVGYWTDPSDGEKDYVGFLPPTGAGLQIKAGIFTGGGFLEWGRPPNVNERFAGVIYVKVGLFEVTAFGIHELTGTPTDADRKTSFIMVLGVRFSPGIQLGFGFEISGFGGLIGINRRADTDALRERLTSGAAGNVLFAEDPIRNAPALIGDLGALFPAAAGVYVFGPTIQISWLNLAGFKVFRIDVGLFFEFTGASLTKIVMLGSVRATVPPIEDLPKLLELRFDIVGFVDFPKRVLEVDATLIKSHALYVFHLTGDLAFRISWGDRPYLLLSFGGFHPRFDPKPALFPELTRLALTLDNPTPGLFFRAEAYLAITSNTVQFGGRLEVGYKLGPFNLIGFLGLDAIVQFEPFWFEIAISAGVRLRWNQMTLCGVRLEGTLSGPGPFTISGKACIELLFFDICGSATITLGESSNDPAPALGSVTQALRPELTNPANLSSQGGDDAQAVQQPRPRAATAPPIVSPLGQLRWMQKRVPFDTTLDRLEGQPLAAQQSVVAECTLSKGTVPDWFAPGSFTNLSEAEALNRPGFERLDAGLLLGFDTQQSTKVPHDVQVIEVRLPKLVFILADAFAFAAVTLAGARSRTGAAEVRTRTAKISVSDERFIVRDKTGAKVVSDKTVTEAHQQARRLGGVALQGDDLIDLGGV
jgi:hypothetical protein